MLAQFASGSPSLRSCSTWECAVWKSCNCTVTKFSFFCKAIFCIVLKRKRRNDGNSSKARRWAIDAGDDDLPSSSSSNRLSISSRWEVLITPLVLPLPPTSSTFAQHSFKSVYDVTPVQWRHAWSSHWAKGQRVEAPKTHRIEMSKASTEFWRTDPGLRWRSSGRFFSRLYLNNGRAVVMSCRPLVCHGCTVAKRCKIVAIDY